MKLPKHFGSKKWTMTIMGFSAVLLIHFSSLVSCIYEPNIAAQIVNLSNLSIVFMGSLVGAYAVGQSFVDWKHGSNYQTNESSQRSYSEEKRVNVNYNIDLENKFYENNKRASDYPPKKWVESYER